MKLQLLHGPGINAARSKLLQLRKKFHPDNVIVFEEGEEKDKILTNLQSIPLFDGERLVIIENPPDDLSPVTFDSDSLTLILWFDHEIDPKKYPKAEVMSFSEIKEISVFPFLDKLGSREKDAFLELDKLKTAVVPAGRQGFETQYFITMIFYLLRNLVATPKGAKEFVKNKNARMRKNFSQEDLTNLYKSVLETDFKIKSGLLDPLQAEFSLVNLFTQ